MLAQQDAHLQLNNAVEVVGKVQQDLSVKVFQAMDFGSNIGTGVSTFFAMVGIGQNGRYMADFVGAMQISMPLKQSLMPPIGTRRCSMIPMTELPVVRIFLSVVTGRRDWKRGRVVGEGLYNDDEAHMRRHFIGTLEQELPSGVFPEMKSSVSR